MLQVSWPYLAILSLAVVWRQAFFIDVFNLTNKPPNAPLFLTSFSANPFSAIQNFANAMVKDSHYLMITAWANTVNSTYVDITSPFLIASWILVCCVLGGTYVFLTQINFKGEQVSQERNKSWRFEVWVVGFALIILGPMPYWVANEQITVGLFSDRFALAGMLGASILIFAWIDTFSPETWQKTVLVSILVSLGVGYHLRIANEYRWEWEEQGRFYWQLYWRVPDLESDTPIYSEGAIFSFTGDYPTSFAINTLYDQKNSQTDLNYWFFELDEKFFKDPKSLLQGTDIKGGLRNYSFTGYSLNGLVIHFAPEAGNCLWILGPSDAKNEQLPSLVRQALPLSDLSRIIFEPPNDFPYPDSKIFGEEPAHDWCYYYQKADLARQQNNWDLIVKLGEESELAGFQPNNRIEWVPFIEGYAHTGNWEKAQELTISAYKTDVHNRKYYCSLWQQFSETDQNPIISNVHSKLGCP